MPVKVPGKPPEAPSGLPLADARVMVDEAAKRLFSPEGRAELDYLNRSRRLTEATIKAARLGSTSRADGVPWKPPGVVIPWFDAGRLALVKIRPPDEWRESFRKDRRPPPYIEAFRDCPTVYPGPEVIRPGAPLSITEGELDDLLLAQELGDLASVITLGSASIRPEGSTYLAMLRCPVWYLALDGDPAGDKAAGEWPARARRVRPPAGKDWTEAAQAGIDLRRWWIEEVFADRSEREERAAIREFDEGPPPPAVVGPPISPDRQDVAARGDDRRSQGLALPLCWLPEPQGRVVLPPLPRRRDDGKLWFE
jgi:hypothetical protein